MGESDSARGKLYAQVDNLPRVLPELMEALLRFCPDSDRSFLGAIRNMSWVILFIVSGIAVGAGTTSLLRRNYLRSQERIKAISQTRKMSETSPGKTVAGIITALPSLLGLMAFFLTAYGLYLVSSMVDTYALQLLFFGLLLSITLTWLFSIFSGILLSPQGGVRMLPFSDDSARLIHRLVVWTWGYIASALIFSQVVRHLGAGQETVTLVKVLAGTLLLGLTAIATILARDRVKSSILAAHIREHGSTSWSTERLASLWHVLVLLYLFLLWVLMISSMLAGDQPSRGAFVMSFFILPIWLMADRLIQWLVRYALQTLKLDGSAVVAQATGTEGGEGQGTTRRIVAKVMPVARTGVVMVLGFWLASLWGYDLPFMSKLVGAAVDSLVIVALALIFWRALSSWIEAKIVESMPEKSGEDDTHDDEWGPHTVQDRSLTLLPIVRKFVGIILVVMVAMTVLSSLGVDIGPLLAGAGVLGLAVGFGAQKIVSDIFSGFFYLLDDAFRVGEYVNAGSISGTVEKITLRNLMLRHHRGMLQIVPHSDLGPITNFMRGGIIEKFSLDFPYDTDIDKIRKIIKKVGQEMLDDPELGENFLRPMKSQGVREITNSVMTIRVKFTAKPGTHFLIRREAFKRITQALTAKGIQYAHRKVIVDLPAVAASEDAGQQARLAQAAGAAAQRIIEQEEEQLKAEQAQKAGKA